MRDAFGSAESVPHKGGGTYLEEVHHRGFADSYAPTTIEAVGHKVSYFLSYRDNVTRTSRSINDDLLSIIRPSFAVNANFLSFRFYEISFRSIRSIHKAVGKQKS